MEQDTSRLGRVQCSEIVRSPNRVYRWKDIFVTPHIDSEILAYAYQRFRDEGTLRYLFHENPIDRPPDIEWFLERYKQMVVLACFHQPPGAEQAKLIGLGWCNVLLAYGPYGKTEFGEAFLRGWAPDIVMACGQLMVCWAFSEIQVATLHGPGHLQLALGTTPTQNPAAIQYFQKLGFDSLPPIPQYTMFDGELCDSVISYMTREKWRDTFGLVEPAAPETECAA